MLGTLETILHGQTIFRLAGGSLNWSETHYFHKGGPLRMVPKFDFRNGAKKSGHLDHLSQSNGQIYVSCATRASNDQLSMPNYGVLN